MFMCVCDCGCGHVCFVSVFIIVYDVIETFVFGAESDIR